MPYLSWEERRSQFIDAAIEVIAAEGLARLTTRRIAERAEAPLGALHYCFRNKDELIQLITERGAKMLVESFAAVDPDRGIEATIRESIAALWDWYQDNIGLQLALTELGMNRIRRGGDPAEIHSMWGPYGLDLLTEHLERAVEVDSQRLALPIAEVVRFVLGRFDGLTLEYAASKDSEACRRQVEILADAIVAVALPEVERTPPARSAAARSR